MKCLQAKTAAELDALLPLILPLFAKELPPTFTSA
jgi:hypothetical protein